MAASCLGAFGSYKLQYSRFLRDRLEREKTENQPTSETVWVTKRYAPTDERVIAPVPRHKHVVPRRVGQLNVGEGHWIPVSDPPLSSFDRLRRPVSVIYVSHPATRSEEWSTLRQTLPSYGNIKKVDQPRWGITLGTPPVQQHRVHTRFPHVDSCMTKYVDEMHKTNRQFRHC